MFLGSSLLLIEPVTAAGYAEAQRAAGYAEAQRAAEEVARPKPMETVPGTNGTGEAPPRAEGSAKPAFPAGGSTPPQPAKKQFYGSIKLDTIQAKKQFADLVDEVVLQFTFRPGVKVRIAIEIQAEVSMGFDDIPQRVGQTSRYW